MSQLWCWSLRWTYDLDDWLSDILSGECTDLYLGSVSIWDMYLGSDLSMSGPGAGLFSVKRFFTKPPPLSSCSAAACLVLYYRGEKICYFFTVFSIISLLFLYQFSTRGNSLLFLLYMSYIAAVSARQSLSQSTIRSMLDCCVSRRWLLLRQDCPGRIRLDGYQGEAQWA